MTVLNQKLKKNFFFPFLRTLALTFFVIHFLLITLAVAQNNHSSYTFTLDSAVNTSAGVYSNDVLIRKLWSCKPYQAGTHYLTWDGKDDDGNQMPAGKYTVHILQSNVSYVWEGSHIGNSSTYASGSKVHRVYSSLSDISVADDKAAYVSGYSERLPSIFGFNINIPQEKQNIFNSTASTPHITRVANDGTNFYYAGFDAYQTNISFILGTRISDNSPVKFAGGENYSIKELGDNYNVAGISKSAGSTISSLTVQAGNRFLIFTRPQLNQIIVLDKTSGNLIKTITEFETPKAVAFDRKGFIWLSYGRNTICKFQLSSDGTLVKTPVTINGVDDPGEIDVNYDSSLVGVVDYDSQTLKFFSNQTGAPQMLSIGKPGGYMTSSVAANDKFCLKTLANGNLAAGFCFTTDGSIWIADTGNNRFQHFNSDGKFLESIYIPGPTYFTHVDAGNTRRVVGGLLEYSVDYSKKLSGSTGWALTNNWRATVPKEYDQFHNMHFIKTMTWGNQTKTFTMMVKSGELELIELVKNGTMRFTGKTFGNNALIDDENYLVRDLKRFKFNGFDGDGNPKWESPESLADLTTLTVKAPTDGYRGRPFLTSDNKVVFFNNYTKSKPVNGYHIGIMQKGGNSWLSLTAKGTHEGYNGEFPEPEYFDIGNGVNDYSGSNLNVLGKNLFAGYHGEFWKAAQTNKFNHYWSNGLAIGQFGTTRAETIGEAPAMMDGNALSPQFVWGDNTDIAFLYHGGESNHGGTHRWKITGLNSIKEQSLDIVYPSLALACPRAKGIDLMQGLTSGTLLARGQNGWDGAAEEKSSSAIMTAIIGYASYKPNDPDLSIAHENSTNHAERSITRVLQEKPSTLNAWALTGKINFDGTNPNADYQGGSVMEILDKSKKVITQFYLRLANGGWTFQLLGNDKMLFSKGADSARLLTNFNQPFSINFFEKNITFKYAGYSQSTKNTVDPKADITSPTMLRFSFYETDNNMRGRRMVVQQLRFYSKMSQAIDFSSIPSKNLGMAPFNLSATASSKLQVHYNVISGPATISGSVLTITGEGTVVIQATQDGNEFFESAEPLLRSFKVKPRRRNL
jgi:hypothetical protein